MASQACNTVPAIVSVDYTEKGTWTEIDGMKTYTNGPPHATKAILIFYDVFGFYPQTLQGADILAAQGWLCVMPDFFRGQALSVDDFPPENEEAKAKVAAFRANHADPTLTVPKIPGLMQLLRKTHPKAERWAALGYCWGGKIVSLACGPGTAFVAGAQSSPGAVEPAEAERVTVPMCMLASSGEDEEVVEKYKEGLAKAGKGACVERYDGMVHGWMSARGDLGDGKVKDGYERGYQRLVEFFGGCL